MITVRSRPAPGDGLCSEVSGEIWNAVMAISGDMREQHGANASSSVPLGDIIGGALLHRYLHSVSPDGGFDAVAEQYLDRALAAVHRLPLMPLYSGVVGVGWLLAHIARLDGDEPDVSDLDTVLLEQLRQPWTGTYDVITGLAGVGSYALERMTDTVGAELLGLVIRRLADMAETANGVTSWHTPPQLIPPSQRANYPNGYHNLGLAHGVPGVIRILSQAVENGVEEETARTLLLGSVPWLLSNLQRVDRRWCLAGNAESALAPKTRLAWCYNELGAMTAVIAAAGACGRAEWRSRASEVLRSTIGTSENESGCRDASLCHGAAGVGHLYQVAAQDLEDEVFAQEAKRWFGTVMAVRRTNAGSGGFLYYTVTPETKQASYEPNFSFLEGASGIGLALVSAAWNLVPGWNRLLALS
jgi:lantibiotic modifying enzyme